MSLSSTCNGDYGRKEYWDQRYEEEEEFEWCKDYDILKPLLAPHLVNGETSILMLGCGNSELSGKLYADGYQNITNIDFSSTVVSKMEEKYGETNMKWEVMDMRHLTLPSSSFDIVIEKATLDVLFVNEKSPWSVSPQVQADMDAVLSGVSRVLKPSGKFISITFAQPHFRNKFYKQYWTNCQYSTFGTGFHYYFYVNSNGDNTV